MIPYVFAFLFAALLVLVRLVKGPTAPDRMIAFVTTTTITIGTLVMLSIHFGKAYLVDIAILYALLTFVATAMLSKYIQGKL